MSEEFHHRLSDLILDAMELALDQKDAATAETLKLALEKSMTRKAGGENFNERRDYPPRIEAALERLDALKS
jgi:hypothetical protein